MNNVDNLFAKDGFFWWVGVVEDRKDPLKLGRVKVRILGYHFADLQTLPTEDLPWAMPMQPILSAANSGVGDAPVGPVEGTWCIGFFADGADCQQPIVMGTIGAIPNSSATCIANSQSSTANQQKNAQGNSIGLTVTSTATTASNTSSNAITHTLPPLTQAQTQSLMDALGQKESSSVPGGAQNYSTVNSIGYVGKYQMGASTLQTLGYITAPVGGGSRKNSELSNSNIWTGKDGINSESDFLNNKNNVQETSMFSNLNMNYNTLVNNGTIDSSNSTPDQTAGYLAAAHLVGAGGATQLAKGTVKADANGTTASTYYALGSNAVGGNGSVLANAPAPLPVSSLNSSNTNYAGSLNNPKLGSPDAFTDPNAVYPTCDYSGRQDTNQLATNNDSLNGSPLPDKDKNRVKDITIANQYDVNWDEPPSAFKAKYPYNHVKQTESGHVVEFDDTPNAERIHIWHRTGTYVEIDQYGTVSYKVKGDNYEVMARNSNVYVGGNYNVTVEGAHNLQIKNTLNVEVLGHTTVNLKGNADINVSETLNLKAQNINIEAQQNLNMYAQNMYQHTSTDWDVTANNYANVKTGGSLNFTVGGNEEHRISGTLDADASIINVNSGTSSPIAPVDAIKTGLPNGVVSPVGESTNADYSLTNTKPLPVNTATTSNATAKSLSTTNASYASNNNAVGTPSNGINTNTILTTGGLASGINTYGAPAINNLIKTQNQGSVDDIFRNAGVGNISFVQTIQSSGYKGLNASLALAGLGNFENVLQKAGITINAPLGNASPAVTVPVNNIVQNQSADHAIALEQGQNILNAFKNIGVTKIDASVPVKISVINTDATEFANWNTFPDSTQLSKYFTLGSVSTRVHDVNFQFPIQDQGGYTRYQIITNLKALCINVLDKIYTQYQTMVINDAFRPTIQWLQTNATDNNALAALASSLSDIESTSTTLTSQLSTPNPYNIGLACNLHFTNASASDYFTIAQWIKNNVSYDQIRLEYTTLGNSEPWIGITFKSMLNRAPEALDKNITLINGTVVANYLADLSSF